MLQRWNQLKLKWRIGIAVVVVCLIWLVVHAPSPVDVIIRLPEGSRITQGVKAEAIFMPARCIPFVSCVLYISQGALTAKPVAIASKDIEEVLQPEVEVLDAGSTLRLSFNRRFVFSPAGYKFSHLTIREDGFRCSYVDCPETAATGFGLSAFSRDRAAVAQRPLTKHRDPRGRLKVMLADVDLEKLQRWPPWQKLKVRIDLPETRCPYSITSQISPSPIGWN